MSIATTTNPLVEYVKKLAAANPAEAVQIALAEAEREKAVASTAHAEYRALAEVKFDDGGRIVQANLGGLWRLAQMYAGSKMVPEHYREKPNDCFIACQMAFRLRVDPFAYMQASYVVKGKPGIEAKLAVAMLNTSGHIVGRIRYEEERDDKKVMTACTAYAFDKETGEKVEARIPWSMVVAEGWLNKDGSKWKTMPDIMFHYRSATFLIRQYYPEVMMGMRTVDELEDITEGQATGELKPVRTLDDLTARLAGPTNSNGHAVEGVVETADLPKPVVEKQPDEETTDRPAATAADGRVDNLADMEAGFRACNSLTEVGKFEAELLRRPLTEDEKTAVDATASQTREYLRNQAAAKKGGTQKELVGR
jgi:hypothetical protein